MSSSYPRIGLSAIVLLLTLSQAPLPSSAAENRFEEDPGNLVITTNSDGEVELPGHRNDVRGLPNMPFSVDANRKSDGLSSISPWTGTSPSFPLYKGGSVYDPSSRTAHEAQTKSSRVTQGVTNKGTGAFEQAQARLKSLVMATASFDNSNVPLDVANGVWSGGSPDPSALPTTDFTVDSTVRWNPSNFAIQSGETYLIEVASSQMWYDDSLDIHVNTLGYDSYFDVAQKCHVAEGKCRSYLRNTLRFKKSNWMHLVCGVGYYATLLQEVGEGKERYMPLKEAEFIDQLFAVDLSYTFTASPEQNGELVCFANDADGLYYDNSGSITVRITRTSWPPSTTFDVNYAEYLKKGLENPSKYDEFA